MEEAAIRRPDGPITGALRVIQAPHRKPLKLALRAWPLLPALALLRPIAAGSAHLPSYAGEVLGLDATLCLLACLTVTPMISVARVKAAKLRWWYGIWMFALGFAGLVIELAAGHEGSVGARAAGSAENWTGLVIIVLLLPMVITSNRLAQKLLGPEWKNWQRSLMWTVWIVTGWHLLLLNAWLTFAAFAGASVPLILLRQARYRKAVKDWRAGGYSTAGWWLSLTVQATLFALCITILAAEEVAQVARALALGP